MKPKTELGTEQTIGRPNRGSATFLALFTLALLTFIGATVLVSVTRRYNGTEKAQGWQEALQAAEAGADVGLQNVRWLATASSTPFDTTLGWAKNTTDPNNTVYTYTTPTIATTGEGTVQTWAVVTVDSPVGNNATSPPSGLTVSGGQWYRIRSTGHAKLSGLVRASNDALTDLGGRNKNALRKFSLIRTWDRSTGTISAVAAPEATRTIEQIVQPKTPFVAALQALTSMSISGNQIIDSYDSSDPAKSTNGLYDPAKRGSNGTIGVGGTRNGVDMPYSSGSLTIGSGEKVYGNVATDGGSFTDANKTIQAPGTITNTVNNNFPEILNPNWGTPGNPPINNSYSTISKATTITANSDPNQNYYKITSWGNYPLTVNGTGTINLWVTGDVNGKVASGPMITVAKGTTLKIYLGTQSDTDQTAPAFHPQGYGGNLGAIDNQNQNAANFQLYGVGTGAGADAGGGIDLHAGGKGVQNFYGTVYAPYRYVLMKYDGSTNYDTTSGFYGSFVGNKFTSGHIEGSYHFDEALQNVGTPIDYKRVSYVEDPR